MDFEPVVAGKGGTGECVVSCMGVASGTVTGEGVIFGEEVVWLYLQFWGPNRH